MKNQQKRGCYLILVIIGQQKKAASLQLSFFVQISYSTLKPTFRSPHSNATLPSLSIV